MAKRDFLRRLGPGIVTGAADDDPSGIGTYTSVGATAGYGFLWSALWLLPFAYAVQEACARLALVTGKGLAAIIKTRMPRWVLVVAVLLVAVANTVNIAANLSIMSAALGLLVPIAVMAQVPKGIFGGETRSKFGSKIRLRSAPTIILKSESYNLMCWWPVTKSWWLVPSITPRLYGFSRPCDFSF